MIKKLVTQKLTIAGKEYKYPDTTALVGKINELVDAVNVLQAQVAILEEHAHPTAKTPVDPYAEQRKWIGKLCRFWDDDYEHDYFDTLKGITDEGLFIGHNGSWEHCEPVKPDDDIIYKGE